MRSCIVCWWPAVAWRAASSPPARVFRGRRGGCWARHPSGSPRTADRPGAGCTMTTHDDAAAGSPGDQGDLVAELPGGRRSRPAAASGHRQIFVVGTSHHMAPEQFAAPGSGPTIDSRTDVYAVSGVVLNAPNRLHGRQVVTRGSGPMVSISRTVTGASPTWTCRRTRRCSAARANGSWACRDGGRGTKSVESAVTGAVAARSGVRGGPR